MAETPNLRAKPAERTEVVPPIVFSLKRHNGLGREPKFVRDSDTDSSIADVQAQKRGGLPGCEWMSMNQA